MFPHCQVFSWRIECVISVPPNLTSSSIPQKQVTLVSSWLKLDVWRHPTPPRRRWVCGSWSVRTKPGFVIVQSEGQISKWGNKREQKRTVFKWRRTEWTLKQHWSCLVYARPLYTWQLLNKLILTHDEERLLRAGWSWRLFMDVFVNVSGITHTLLMGFKITELGWVNN